MNAATTKAEASRYQAAWKKINRYCEAPTASNLTAVNMALEVCFPKDRLTVQTVEQASEVGEWLWNQF